ncbi:MAG: hypothetical protein DIU79_12425 [Actinobacteria bacterium]|nr:MAG: hypothetical protein DIU79_12425 [Actinomycetota bacterium]
MTTVPARLVRLRWAVRAVLALGVAASVAANVLSAEPHPIARAISAWPPLALLLTVELISRVPVHRRGLAAVRLAATAVIAGIAAWVSYWHMVDVAARYGETGASPYLLPLSVDGLIVVASICLVELGGRLRTAVQSTPSAPSAPSCPAPSAESSDRPAQSPCPPVHAVAASSRPRRRVTVRASSDRPPLDLATVRRVLGDMVPSSRDELARIVRAAGLSVSNARASQLLRELRAAS